MLVGLFHTGGVVWWLRLAWIRWGAMELCWTECIANGDVMFIGALWYTGGLGTGLGDAADG